MKTDLTRSVDHSGSWISANDTERFRVRFQRALRSCVRRRFSVAECFGVIWLETLEEIALTDEQQSELYEELIHWAKFRLFPEVIHSHSPELFTANHYEIRGKH